MKSICIPVTPPVDVTDFLPIIDHPHFQKLRERKQLGINYLVFPGAVHTRFEHAIGVLALTQQLCRIHPLPAQDARNLQAFALLHDIGHGPFSHQIEPVLDNTHHAIGIQRLQDMRDTIDACGIDTDAIIAMLNGTHPLAPYVSDRNLGTDKLDYLMRDAFHIGFHGTPDIEKIQFYTSLIDGSLAIEAKYIEDIKQLQKFYSYLHQHGYLNKSALIAQRMLQRAITTCPLDAAAQTTIWDMTDTQLMTYLEATAALEAQPLIGALTSRQLHRTCLSIKPQGYAFVEHQDNKDLTVTEWSLPNLRAFSERVSSLPQLTLLEDTLATAVSRAPGTLLFASMPYFDKLVPKDVRVFSHAGADNFWLLQADTDHKHSLESDYLRTFAIRLAVPETDRNVLARQTDIFLSILTKN